jgi:hypothetical protein
VPPPRSAAAISSARCAKSDARIENASSIIDGAASGEVYQCRKSTADFHG